MKTLSDKKIKLLVTSNLDVNSKINNILLGKLGYYHNDVKEKVLNFNKYCNMLKQKAMESEEAKGNAFIVIMIQQEFNKEFGDFEK